MEVDLRAERNCSLPFFNLNLLIIGLFYVHCLLNQQFPAVFYGELQS
jgi:hypothetical protein